MHKHVNILNATELYTCNSQDGKFNVVFFFFTTIEERETKRKTPICLHAPFLETMLRRASQRKENDHGCFYDC